MKKIFIGFDKSQRLVFLDPETRSTHMHVVGSTGTGKSKFLEWLIRQDIDAGHGLCLIDPHGDLYDDVMRWCSLQGYLNRRRIVPLNPSAGDYVTGFNPFLRSGDAIDTQVSRRVAVTLKAWGAENSDQTPTLERWLRCIFWVLVEKNLSLVEAQYLIDFTRPDLLQQLTANLSDPMIAREWGNVVHGMIPDRDLQNQFQSTKNRLFRLLTSHHLMDFMGQLDHNIDLAECMEKGHILLVNLRESDRLDAMNARLFGALLVNQLFETAKRRRRPEGKSFPRPFYLYLDEFQNFATPDIDRILAEARKMGLHLVLAHQTLGQLEGAVNLQVLLTNAKTKVVFGGLDRESATTMVDHLFVNQLDLQELKEAVTQTKFWPVYGRDQVRTVSRGSSYSTGTSRGESSGTMDSTAYASGMSQMTPDGSFGAGGPITLTDTRSHASGYSRASNFSESESWGESEGESVADIPIYRYEPFEEATQVYSLEEQRHRMADNLMEQWPRHCFIKIEVEKTEPMLVPNVEQVKAFRSRVRSYETKLLEKSPWSLPATQARAAIEERQRALLLPPGKPSLPYPDDEYIIHHAPNRGKI